MDMKKWLSELPRSGKALPVLGFPSAELTGTTVYELTHNAATQAKGIVEIAEKTDTAAAIGMMDLSVEAEAFGCTIRAPQNEIPTVTGALITSVEEADALTVPEVENSRCNIYLTAIRDAKKQITDKPVLAGMIGPFSLAGRLMDVTEALVNCIEDPDFVDAALRRATDFLLKYAKAYKDAGADGIFLAEPLAGLLSPKLEKIFSAPYVKEIISSVQDDSFIIIYHNCGPNTVFMTQSLSDNGAGAYHFGDAVDMAEMLGKMPADRPVGGNISPSGQFVNGTPESIYENTTELIRKCSVYPNFFISSGCDIPPDAKWKNINSFFRAVEDYSKI